MRSPEILIPHGDSNDLREYFGEYGDKTPGVQPDEPKLSGYSVNEIIDIAVECRNKLGYRSPSDFDELLFRLKGRRVFRDFWNPAVGKKAAINILATGKFIVYLSRNVSDKVNNFSLSHELGHYFIHFLGDHYNLALEGREISMRNNMRAYRFGYADVEREANIFAAAFLMPPEEFQQSWGKFRGDVKNLSELYSVEEYTIKKWRKRIDKIIEDEL